jgi:hypothetical protein
MRMPVCILAGSNERPPPAPESLATSDMLTGFKGALKFPSGQSLAAELVERLRDSGRFQEPLIIGPRAIYEPLVDCEIVDVAGPIITTLQRTIEVVRERFATCSAIAVTTCDVLPTATELRRLLLAEYDPHPECYFWWQWVAALPEAMEVSGWKPAYAIRSHENGPIETVYPGHLVVFQPRAVRLELFAQLLNLAYHYRNRPLPERVLPMLGRGVCKMLEADARNLVRGQLPILTVAVPWHLLRAYTELQSQRLTISALERRGAQVLLHRHCRRSARPVVIAVTRIRSFALDIDTKAEWDAACTRGAAGA